MQVMIGATDVTQALEARSWVSLREYTSLFEDIELWVRSMEPDWGDCRIFIEIVLPQGSGPAGRHNQIDMLVCFGQRLALCELKRHASLHRLDLPRCYQQITGQMECLRGLLGDAGADRQCVAPFLLVPHLSRKDIMTLGQDLVDQHGGHHIWPVGAKPDLKGRTDPRRHRLHLVEALEQRLRRLSAPTRPRQADLHDLLYDRLRERRARLRMFEDFKMAKAYLKTISPATRILPDQWYVPGLRRNEQDAATSILANTGIVELIGPPGTGKSTLAKEILHESGSDFLDIRLHGCGSPYDVCATMNEGLRGESPQGIGDETLIQQLAAESCVFWVLAYDEQSANSLAELLIAVRSYRNGSARADASWIIESTRPLSGLEEHVKVLGRLKNQDIARILENITPGGAFHDPEQAVRLAHGNPGRAIRLWRSHDQSEAATANELRWFRHHLTGDEEQVLALMSLAAPRAPFGITLDTVSRWAQVLRQDQPPSEIQASLGSVVRKLESQQLAQVIRLDRVSFVGVLDEILPRGQSMALVSDLSVELTHDLLRSPGEQGPGEWEEGLRDVLLESAEPGTLADVTLQLDMGDLEPFLRSTFRFSYLKRIRDWVDKTGWQGSSPGQAYLLRALRVLAALGTNASLDVATELGEPDPRDAAQCFAFELVRTRAFRWTTIETDSDLRSWLEKADRCEDEDIQAEMYVAAALVLQHSRRSNRAQEVWEILRNRWEQYRHGSTARCLIVTETLAYLNRTKVRKPKDRKPAVDDDTAYGLIHSLACDLAEAGYGLENVQLVCDALFYAVRAAEFRGSEASDGDLLGYQVALRFVEDAQGRTVRRLQILLTQGSIHRHICRRHDIDWQGFRYHMERGITCYLRAFKSALANGHVLHILNATSYMMTFCVKALRFADNADARAVVADKGRDIVGYAQEARERTRSIVKGEEEERVLSTIGRLYAVLLYVTTVSRRHATGEAREQIRSAVASCVDDVLEHVMLGRDPRQRPSVMKYVTETVTNLQRALRFGQCCDSERSASLIALLQPELARLVDGTRVVRPKGKPFSAWKKLSAMLPR